MAHAHSHRYLNDALGHENDDDDDEVPSNAERRDAERRDVRVTSNNARAHDANRRHDRNRDHESDHDRDRCGPPRRRARRVTRRRRDAEPPNAVAERHDRDDARLMALCARGVASHDMRAFGVSWAFGGSPSQRRRAARRAQRLLLRRAVVLCRSFVSHHGSPQHRTDSFGGSGEGARERMGASRLFTPALEPPQHEI